VLAAGELACPGVRRAAEVRGWLRAATRRVEAHPGQNLPPAAVQPDPARMISTAPGSA